MNCKILSHCKVCKKSFDEVERKVRKHSNQPNWNTQSSEEEMNKNISINQLNIVKGWIEDGY